MGIIKTVKGLSAIYYSPLPASGLVADAVWDQLSVNLEGTFTMNQEEDEQTDIFIEEQDVPLDTILKKGKFIVESDIPDFQFSVAERVLGATKQASVDAEGASVTRVSLPDSAQYIYGMFKIVPRAGVEQFYITRGQINGYVTGNLSKTETLNIHLKITALVPLNGGEAAIMYDIKEGTNPGYLFGDPFAADYDLITAWAAVSNGGLSVTVDGGTAQILTDVDFSGITSTADIVNILNDNTTGATWSFDVNEYRFYLQSNTTGSASTIAIATSATTTNLNVATLLNMQDATPVAGS